MSQKRNSEAGEKTYVDGAGWYTFAYPDPWIITSDGTSMSVYEPAHGVGSLTVSSYEAPEPQDPTDMLFEYLSDRKIESEETIQYYESNGNRIAVASYVRDDGKFWRVWFFTRGLLLLFVTYNCKNKFRDVEREAINRIVSTMTLLDL